jgi:hypothetical protein
MATHKGSWFGLPDFGITEAIGGLFNKPRTAQGGSNLIGPNYAQTQPTPQVYGAQTEIPSFSSTGGNPSLYGATVMGTPTGGDGTPTTGGIPPSDGETSGPSPEDLLKQQYIDQLNNTYNDVVSGLGTQKTAQEGIVSNSYNQNISDLGTSTESSKKDVLANQVKTLKDLSENIKNQYMAGNVYLGARGAGDSSAASMYSYALNKMGSKSRGDVLSQVNAQMAKLNNIFTQEQSKLQTERDNNLLKISDWYSQALTQAKEAKGENLTALTSTLLGNAINAVNNVKSQFDSRATALQEWAMNNSTTINELKSNMQQVAGMTPTYNLAGSPTVDSGGNYYAAAPSNTSQEDWLKRLTSV